MTTQTHLTQAQALALQNANARANLLKNGVPMIRRLAVQTAALGSEIQIIPDRVGIITGFLVHISAPVDVTVAATASPIGPIGLVSRISYTDFSNTKRVDTSGFGLSTLNSVKHREIAGLSYAGAPGTFDTDIYNLPTAVGNASIDVSVWIPLAYDAASDLRGAVLAQTNVGSQYIKIQTPNALVGADPLLFPYTAGTVATTGNVSVEVYQFYLQPQGANPIDSTPLVDVSTIYSVQGGIQDMSNIASGVQKYLDYPNNRTVLSAIIQYENGGALTLNGSDINQITLIANSNTNFREMSPRLVRELMRATMRGDTAPSTYYISSRQNPILTQLFGNVQLRFDLNTVNVGTSYFVQQYESMYPSGAPLPGIAQG